MIFDVTTLEKGCSFNLFLSKTYSENSISLSLPQKLTLHQVKKKHL